MTWPNWSREREHRHDSGWDAHRNHPVSRGQGRPDGDQQLVTPKDKPWELDPHTTAKHDILRRYLAAWFPILGAYHNRIVYIDGFSGPGRYKNGEPGSPMIALYVAVNHRKLTAGEIICWFIEERADRLAALESNPPWAPNIWMGVSVESNQCRSRIDHLRATRAMLRFLSLEPLLGPLPNLDLRGIDWVIVGGESGPRARPMDPASAKDIRDQPRRAKVSFFFKQWGGKNKKLAGRLLDGRTWDQMPSLPSLARGTGKIAAMHGAAT